MIANSFLLKVYRSNITLKHNNSTIYWKHINNIKKFNI
jgi:hypothetical protein